MVLYHHLVKKLQTRTLKAAFWTFMGFGAQKAIQLLSNIILTRILFPEAFGLMVIVNVVLIGLAMFSDIGIKPAIVQHPKGCEPKFLNTAWTVQIIRGLVMFVIACAIAWPVAILYKQPDLTSLICACALTTVIYGFNSISIALAERNMELKRLTLLQLSAQVASVITTVIFAFLLQSVWSLVIGNIIAALLTMVFSHRFLAQHKHQLMIDTQSWQAMKRFGRWILGSTLLAFIAGQGIKAVEASLVPLDIVAFLQIATTMSIALTELINALQGKILFPKLSEIQRERPADFRPTLQKVTQKILLMAFFGFTILALLSTKIIDFLYDERYQSAGPYLAIYALGGFLSAQIAIYKGAFLAKGMSRNNFAITLCDATLKLLGLFIGFNLGGIIGMITGTTVASIGTYFLIVFLAQRQMIFMLKNDLIYLLGAMVITISVVMIHFPTLF